MVADTDVELSAEASDVENYFEEEEEKKKKNNNNNSSKPQQKSSEQILTSEIINPTALPSLFFLWPKKWQSV